MSAVVPELSIIENRRLLTEIKLVLSYQYYNQKSISAHYIYHKNEKGKHCEMDLPLLKKISQII